MVLDRSKIRRPSLPKETVAVESLGGEVIVRGLLLSERLENDHVNAKLRVARDGESDDQATARAGAQILPRILHQCVVDAEGERLMSHQEWDEFGALHSADAFLLFNTAMRLSGQDLEGAEKN